MTINDATCVAIDHLQDIMHKRPSGNPCADCAHDRGEACAADALPYVCRTQGRPKPLAHCGEICDALHDAICDSCDHRTPHCEFLKQCVEGIEPEHFDQYPCADCDPRTPEQIAEDKGDEKYHELVDEGRADEVRPGGAR